MRVGVYLGSSGRQPGGPIDSQEVAEGLSLRAERATGCLLVAIYHIFGALQRYESNMEG